MCIRDRQRTGLTSLAGQVAVGSCSEAEATSSTVADQMISCLLYTSDAADERSSVDLGGRRIIKKKKITN